MDGFAGFPLRASTPRGSAFVEFTRGTPPAPPAQPQPLAPPPTPARQESLAIRRGAERVTPEIPTDLNTEGGIAQPPSDGLNTEGDATVLIVPRDRQGGTEA